MDNLLGQHLDRVPGLLADAGNQLPLYGKPKARQDRKMGHVSRRLGD